MLTIQPKVTNSIKLSPAFGQRQEQKLQDYAEDAYYEEIPSSNENDDDFDAKETRAFWESQKAQYEKFADDMALPKPVRKGAKIFSIVSESAIDAIAVFCTGKMMIGGAQKALKSPKVQNILTGGKAVRTAMHTVGSGISDGISYLGRKISATDAYKATAEQFKTNKILHPIANAFNAVKDFVAEKSTAFYTRLSSITAKQYNNAISGTIATGAGVAGAIDETDKYIREQREQNLEAA